MEIKIDELVALALKGLDYKIDEALEKAKKADKKVTEYSLSSMDNEKYQKALNIRKKYEKIASELIRKQSDIEFYFEIKNLEIK